jgi:hypothetical protein
MTEEEFDSFMQRRSFGTEDARRAEAQMSRGMALLATLGVALWGKTEGDLHRQLLKPYPAIPSGFDLPDFRELLRVSAQIISAISVTRKRAGWSHLFAASQTIFVGTQGSTVLEARYEVWAARYEIVRRAIEYLERH